MIHAELCEVETIAGVKYPAVRLLLPDGTHGGRFFMLPMGAAKKLSEELAAAIEKNTVQKENR